LLRRRASYRPYCCTVIAHKKRRLEKLEEQAAIKGISTPPEVLTEIDDLRREIGELEG
jgi:hypothetical protein